MQDFDKHIQEAFKDYFTTKIITFKDNFKSIGLQYKTYRKREISWNITSLLTQSFLNIFSDISFNYFCIVYCCERSIWNKFTDFKDCGQFSWNNSHFQGDISAPEKAFPILALFKEFKDLHEPWKGLKAGIASL